MNAKALFLSRLKATLRSPGAMSVFLLALVIPLLLGLYSARTGEARLRVAVVNHDQGPLGNRLVELVNAAEGIDSQTLDEDEAQRLMRLDLLQCLFVIRPEFTQRLESLEFDHLVDLTVAPGCTYGASVSEPIINAVMKLWFERQTLHDMDRLAGSAGVTLTPARQAGLRAAMESAWAQGAQVQVAYVTQEPSAGGSPALSFPFARTALRWFAALSLLFLILSGQWLDRFGQPQLQQRLRQGGMGFAKGFLVQSCAQLVMVYAGFLAVLLLGGGPAATVRLLLPVLVYGVGILGLALLICAVCRDLTSLLLLGPALGIVAAFLSGLLIELPDWGRVWVTVSGVLPGRQLYTALDGGWSATAALAASALWLGLGTLAAWLSARRRERKTHTLPGT